LPFQTNAETWVQALQNYLFPALIKHATVNNFDLSD